MAMGSRYFDGTNDKLGPVTWTFPGYPFTMAAWVTHPTAASGINTILSYHNAGTTIWRHYLQVNRPAEGSIVWTAGSYRSFFQQGTADWSHPVPLTTQWNHVVGVWTNAASRALYVNGVWRDGDATNVNVPSPANLFIGVSVSTSYFGPGNIAHASVWDVALTANEIATLYQGVNPGRCRQLSSPGYWPLHGIESPEPNIIGGLGWLTVTGAVAADEGAPVIGLHW